MQLGQNSKRSLAAIVGVAAAGVISFVMPQVEGERLTSYKDVVGVLTNCAGNTHNVRPNLTLTKEQCAEIDSANAAIAAAEADACVPMKLLTPGERVAVTLFTINEGSHMYCISMFAKKLRARDPTACLELGAVKDPSGLPKWTTAGGKYWPGLQNRRNVERAICERTDL